MKKLFIMILVSAFALNAGSLWAEGDKDSGSGEKVSLLADTPKVSDAEVYTCPMHPEVRQDKEGKCPICEMNLEKVEASAGSEKKQDSTHDGHAHNAEGQGV